MGARVTVDQLQEPFSRQPGIDPSAGKPKSKYRSRRIGEFASKRESDRFGQLALLEMAGKIRDLGKQVRFHLTVNGIHVCDYIDDFVYVENGERVVEDVKGFRTQEYKLKRKLMLAVHGVTIRET